MKLIVGGRAAGKRAYVQREHGVEARVVSPEEAMTAPAIDRFHEVVRQMLQRGEDVDAYVQRLIEHNPHAIVLCDEVGLGIVPMEREDRLWREAVGRACCALARAADQVIRVVCGLPQVLK